MEEKDILLQQIKEANPYKLVLSNKADKSYEYRKIEIIKSISNKKECYQISCYTEKQVFQKNVDLDNLVPAVEEFFPIYMKQLNAFCEDKEIAVKETKSHKLLVNTTKAKTTDVLKRKTEITHNRQKNYIINEGEIVTPLVDMGIFTKEGKVVKSMDDKYKQIN